MEKRQGHVGLATIGGIRIYLHYSWLAIAGLILLGFWGQLSTVHPDLSPAATAGLALVGTVVFFGSVLVHELAHAVVARRRGIEVKGITLYLFGGATEADASSRSAGDEFVIAIVGPLTSLLIAAVLALAAVPFGSQDDPVPDLLLYLSAINVLLAVFNLAPGLPLDGGRVFRSITWAITGDFTKATRWATNAGVGVGYLLMATGLMAIWQGLIGGLWLVAIGWMIAQSARQNEYQERIRSTFGRLSARDVMSTPVITIPADTSISDAIRDHFARRDQTVYPVVDGDRILGVLSVAAVRSVPASEIQSSTAGQVALGQEPPPEVEPTTPMSEVIEILSRNARAKARVLVVDDGRLVGIISPSDIFRRQALADLVQSSASGPRR